MQPRLLRIGNIGMALKKSELYSSLWSSCDELRGGMDASQYKDYVLVLLFIKYVSDKYAGVPYAPITIPPGASFKKRTREAVDFLVAALESGHSEVLTAYLGAMAKFHTYSFGNIMLIARQRADATNVAGLRTWNSLGRFVKRGEKGIFILAPMVGKRSTKDVATDEP